MLSLFANWKVATMPEPQTWYALMHRPGPALTDGQAVFDHPGIAGHFGFLQQLATAGSLIAAGPLVDSDGDGMTVIRAGSLDEARHLAEEVDTSVREGVLTVTVRPWQVIMAPVDERN